MYLTADSLIDDNNDNEYDYNVYWGVFNTFISFLYSKAWVYRFLIFNPIITGMGGGGVGGGRMYHRGIFLSRTLERQMILNWNFVTFNIFLWWIKCWKNFLEKICQLSVMTVLSRASDDIFTYSFCVVNFIGNYVKISL